LIRAGDYATKIARNYPNSAGAHLFLARIYEASGLMSDALEEVKKSLEIDAGNGEAKALLERLTPRP
jgi:tetratricopeptide (TPR) repeat protein